MAREIEVKIIGIDPGKIRATLQEHGAVRVKEVFQRNTLFTGKAGALPKGTLVRLRQEDHSSTVTLCVKGPKQYSSGHKVRDEYEVDMPEEDAVKMLGLIGLRSSHSTEAKREYWSLEKCSVEIIWLPRLPPFLEIEGTEADIKKVATILGFSEKNYDDRSIFEIFGLKKGDLRF